MTPTEQRPQECKHCKEYVETGQWYVNGRLEPYGRCERQFRINRSNPCGYDVETLANWARVRWNSTCPYYKPKEKKDNENK